MESNLVEQLVDLPGAAIGLPVTVRIPRLFPHVPAAVQKDPADGRNHLTHRCF